MCLLLIVRGLFKASLHSEEIMDLHKTKEVNMQMKVWKHPKQQLLRQEINLIAIFQRK